MAPTRDDERELARLIRARDRDARDRLALRYRWAAREAAIRAARHGEWRDLEGDAMLAILEAADGYDGERPFRDVARESARRAVRKATLGDGAASVTEHCRRLQRRFRAATVTARQADTVVRGTRTRRAVPLVADQPARPTAPDVRPDLVRAMATLTEPEREAIRRRYGLDGCQGDVDEATAARAETKLREAMGG